MAGTGNAASNVITGNSGVNTLSGLEGDDVLIGAGGSDTMTGGAGADHFDFIGLTSGIDTITDFNVLDGGAAEGDVLHFIGLQSGTFAYVGAAAFSASGNTEARFVTGQLLMDFNGDGTSDMTLRMTGLTAETQISGSDFLFT